MARSLSEIVQQLYANDQLIQDCAHALSMQLGGADSISRQQMQGDIAFTIAVSALTSESSCQFTPSVGLLHNQSCGRCLLHLFSVKSVYLKFVSSTTLGTLLCLHASVHWESRVKMIWYHSVMCTLHPSSCTVKII